MVHLKVEFRLLHLHKMGRRLIESKEAGELVTSRVIDSTLVTSRETFFGDKMLFSHWSGMC